MAEPCEHAQHDMQRLHQLDSHVTGLKLVIVRLYERLEHWQQPTFAAVVVQQPIEGVWLVYLSN